MGLTKALRLGKVTGCVAVLLAAAGASLSQLLLVVESRTTATAQPSASAFRIILARACPNRPSPAPLAKGTREDKSAAKPATQAPAPKTAPRLLKPITDNWDTASAADSGCTDVPVAPEVSRPWPLTQSLLPTTFTLDFSSLAQAPPTARGPPES